MITLIFWKKKELKISLKNTLNSSVSQFNYKLKKPLKKKSVMMKKMKIRKKMKIKKRKMM